MINISFWERIVGAWVKVLSPEDKQSTSSFIDGLVDTMIEETKTVIPSMIDDIMSMVEEDDD